MAVTPTGNLSSVFSEVRDLLSESAAFQTWVGVANAPDALPFIYIIGVDEPDATDKRPFAFVHTPAQTWAKIDADTSTPQNAVHLTFEEDVAAANQAAEGDALYAFTNVIGAIIAEMHLASLLVDMGIEFEVEPQRTNESEAASLGDLYMAEIRVSWGFQE